MSADPVHPNSAALLAAMAPGSALHLDLGTTEEYYGIPWTVVPADQPLVPITFGTDGYDYSDESDPGPTSIPRDVPIEGGSAGEPDPASGDRHVLVLRQGATVGCSSCSTPCAPRAASRRARPPYGISR